MGGTVRVQKEAMKNQNRSTNKNKEKNDRPFIVGKDKKNRAVKGTDSFIESPEEDESVRWASDSEKNEDGVSKSLENKRRFFEKDIKMEDVLPEGNVREESVPNRLGYFETEEGTMSVGYDKYRRNGLMGFSLLSDDEVEDDKIPQNDPYDMNTYFGKNYKGDEKYFEATALSFTYDPNTEKIDKIQDDDNNSWNDKEELLYQTSKEEKNVDKMRDIKDEVTDVQKDKIDKSIEITQDIKEKKEERNKDFLNEIEKFIKKFRGDKLNRLIDSEDAITRRKRVVEMSTWIIEYTRIKKKLQEMNIKNLSVEEIYSKIKDKVNKLTKDDIKRIIKELKNQ